MPNCSHDTQSAGTGRSGTITMSACQASRSTIPAPTRITSRLLSARAPSHLFTRW